MNRSTICPISTRVFWIFRSTQIFRAGTKSKSKITSSSPASIVLKERQPSSSSTSTTKAKTSGKTAAWTSLDRHLASSRPTTTTAVEKATSHLSPATQAQGWITPETWMGSSSTQSSWASTRMTPPLCHQQTCTASRKKAQLKSSARFWTNRTAMTTWTTTSRDLNTSSRSKWTTINKQINSHSRTRTSTRGTIMIWDTSRSRTPNTFVDDLSLSSTTTGTPATVWGRSASSLRMRSKMNTLSQSSTALPRCRHTLTTGSTSVATTISKNHEAKTTRSPWDTCWTSTTRIKRAMTT